MTECTGIIKDCGIDVHFVVDKLLEYKIINATEKRRIIARERTDELLHIILSSIHNGWKSIWHIPKCI